MNPNDLSNYATVELEREVLIRAIARHGAQEALLAQSLTAMRGKQLRRVAEFRRLQARVEAIIATRHTRILAEGGAA